MYKPKGYDEVQVKEHSGEIFKLPPNGYICKILQVSEKVSEGEWKSLNFLLDIAEGQYKDFFAKDYERQKKAKADGTLTFEVKWRGVYRLTLPENYEEDSEDYNKAVRRVKIFLTSVERSNDGYVYNWTIPNAERTLMNKYIGMVFGEEAWNYNGKSGITCKALYPRSTEHIRSGKFEIPQLKDQKQQSAKPTKPTPQVTADDLPF